MRGRICRFIESDFCWVLVVFAVFGGFWAVFGWSLAVFGKYFRH